MAKTAHITGMLVRQGFSYLTGMSAAWQAVLAGAVVNSGGQNGEVLWSGIQATSGSGTTYNAATTGTGTISNGAIDAAFVACRNYNATNPAIPWRVKLRVDAGIYQPAWLKTMFGTVSNGTDTLTPFWSAAYRAVWKNLMLTLAAYKPADGLGLTLDLHPNMGEFGFGASMTTYAEPMLITGWTFAQLASGTGSTPTFSPANETGYAAVAQPALKNLLADTIAAWPNTPVDLSFNPYCNTADTFTETSMTYMVSSVASGGAGGVSPQGVLQNNSLRNTSKGVIAPTHATDPNTGLAWCTYGTTYKDPLAPSASYTAQYAAMAKLGPGPAASGIWGNGFPIAQPSPICFQTAQLSRIGTATDLMNTLSYAAWLGARSIELPVGFDGGGGLTSTQLGKYNALFAANDPVTTQPTGPVIQVIPFATPATQAANTPFTIPNLATTAGSVCAVLIGARGATAPSVSISGGGSWNARVNQNSAGLFANCTEFDLVPVSSIGASGVTVQSTVAGSIEGVFFEIGGLGTSPYEASVVVTSGSGAGTAPSASITPGNAGDVVIGGIFWPNATATLSNLPAGFTNQAPAVGIAASEGSSLQAGYIVPGTTAAQTYNGTLSTTQFWVAVLVAYTPVPVTKPTQVSQVSAVATTPTTAAVSFATPSNGGAPISSFSAKVFIGGVLQTTILSIDPAPNYLATPYNLTGLTANTSNYTVQIAAVNSQGTGTYSTAAAFATPAANTAPAQVGAVTAVAGNASGLVNWPTPDNGGSPLTSYTLTATIAGVPQTPITGIAVLDYSSATGSPYVLSGLTNASATTVTVAAVNAVGTGTASAASNSFTPTAGSTIPATPAAPAVTAFDTVCTSTITPPANGGATITGYTGNCYNPDGSLEQAITQAGVVFTFTGLTDGLTYGFSGIAINANGPSLESAQTFATPQKGYNPPPPPPPPPPIVTGGVPGLGPDEALIVSSRGRAVVLV